MSEMAFSIKQEFEIYEDFMCFSWLRQEPG